MKEWAKGTVVGTSIDEAIKAIYSKISKQEKIAFICALICGFIAHGYMLTNKLSFHDDMSAMFGLGSRLEQGRWFLEILKQLGDFFSIHVSSAWYNGIVSLLFLALSSLMTVKIVEIKSDVNAALCGGMISVFPTVAATFAYMFTAPAYCMAVLIMCVAVYCVKKQNGIGVVIGGILISVSLGIYQSYIGIFSSLAIIVLIKNTMQEEKLFPDIMRRFGAFLCSGALGVGLYLSINKIMCHLLNKKSIYGATEFEHLPDALISSYKNFFNFFKETFYGINPYRGLRYITLFLLCVTIVLFFYKIFFVNLKVINKVFACFLFMLFPIAINFVYVITMNDVTIHSLMLYPLCYIFVMFVAMSEMTEKRKSSGKVVTWIYSLGVLAIICAYIKVDNVAYQYCSFVQEQTMTYYTNLIGTIKNCSGYDDELPVAFLNIERISDDSMPSGDKFNVSLMALGFDMRQVVGDYSYKQYLEIHCGYAPSYLEKTELEKIKEHSEVKKMPCYPDDGSVRIIDNIVVVKFAEKP